MTGGQLGLFAVAFVALLVIVVLSTPPLANLVELLWLKIRVLLGL
jgi:hypothetical protein